MNSTPDRNARPGKGSWLLAAALALVLALLLYSVYGLRQRTPLRLGEPSPQTFVAPVQTEVVDLLATQRQRQAAREQIEPVYTVDTELRDLVIASIGASGLPSEAIAVVIDRYQDPRGVRAADADVERRAYDPLVQDFPLSFGKLLGVIYTFN